MAVLLTEPEAIFARVTEVSARLAVPMEPPTTLSAVLAWEAVGSAGDALAREDGCVAAVDGAIAIVHGDLQVVVTREDGVQRIMGLGTEGDAQAEQHAEVTFGKRDGSLFRPEGGASRGGGKEAEDDLAGLEGWYRPGRPRQQR